LGRPVDVIIVAGRVSVSTATADILDFKAIREHELNVCFVVLEDEVIFVRKNFRPSEAQTI
jgi:hypothetical protein